MLETSLANNDIKIKFQRFTKKKNRYDWLKCQEGKQYTCYWLRNGGGRDGIDTVTMNKEEEREEERKKYKKKENKIRNKNEIRHYNFATFRNCKRMKKVVIQKCFFSLFRFLSPISPSTVKLPPSSPFHQINSRHIWTVQIIYYQPNQRCSAQLVNQ